MTRWIKLTVAFALLTLIAGCIPTQRELRMERDLEEMKKRLAKAEINLAAQGNSMSGELEQRLDALGRAQADQQVQLDGLKVDMQSIHGRLEDQLSSQDGIRSDLDLIRDDLGLKLNALEERLEKTAPREEQVPVSSAAPQTAPESLYETALEKIQKTGDFAGAIQNLQLFLQQNPNHPLAVNALYWIGEAYYGEKSYENAILQFQDVIQKHPAHPKASAAMFKQALAFAALGDSQNTKILLQKVQDSYPQSTEAAKARDRLAEYKN